MLFVIGKDDSDSAHVVKRNVCADYAAGKLGTVSTTVRSGMAISNITLVNQNLCGDRKTVIQTMIDGAPLYFEPRFITFRDLAGRAVWIRQ